MSWRKKINFFFASIHFYVPFCILALLCCILSAHLLLAYYITWRHCCFPSVLQFFIFIFFLSRYLFNIRGSVGNTLQSQSWLFAKLLYQKRLCVVVAVDFISFEFNQKRKKYMQKWATGCILHIQNKWTVHLSRMASCNGGDKCQYKPFLSVSKWKSHFDHKAMQCGMQDSINRPIDCALSSFRQSILYSNVFRDIYRQMILIKTYWLCSNDTLKTRNSKHGTQLLLSFVCSYLISIFSEM